MDVGRDDPIPPRGCARASDVRRLRHALSGRPPCVKGAVGGADWGIVRWDFVSGMDKWNRPVGATLAVARSRVPHGAAGRPQGSPLRDRALIPAQYKPLSLQSLRHGFAVPPPFTQGRLWRGRNSAAHSVRRDGVIPPYDRCTKKPAGRAAHGLGDPQI